MNATPWPSRTCSFRPLSLAYLTCPYSHPSAAIREARYKLVTKAAGWLIQRGVMVFSPITHSHPIHSMGGFEGDWATWKKLDLTFLDASARVINLVIPGWRDSLGVNEERAYARMSGVPETFLLPIFYQNECDFKQLFCDPGADY